ncbi:MAG: TMEM165/GDT1 family protein [Sandarakinorhabdus sp.]|nr:TMEM165/GDT1 family protein [Sandarakinorhabdus sp.]
MLEAFLLTAGTAFMAEFGDKSQLLAMVLAARYRNPGAVIGGMALGMFANHVLAAAVGILVTRVVSGDVLRWIIAGGFFAAALWVLRSGDDKEMAETVEAPVAPVAHWGPFLTTAVTFFVVEMGDKTQLMTVALSARFELPVAVALGATTGMLMATVPAVLLADRLLAKLPVRLIRRGSALVFVAVGVATLLVAG